MKAVLYCLAVLTLIVASPASAQHQAGDNEIQLQGSLAFDFSDQDKNSGDLFVNFGRYFSIYHEVGFSARGRLAGDGDLSGMGGAFYRFNLPLGLWVPYAGASVSAGFGDFSSDPQLIFESGIRRYLESNLALNMAVNGTDVTSDDFGERLELLFGFSYLPGR
jgi:hypothetical protein